MFIIILLILVILFFIYDRKCKSYWAELGVYSPPSQFYFGHIFHGGMTGHTSLWNATAKYYKKAKSYGIMGYYEGFIPKIVIMDTNLIKNILVKDFEHFVDRRTFQLFSTKDKITKSMIVSVTGEKWKLLRSATTAMFSSGKMKGMYTLIEKEAECCKDFCYTAMIEGKSINMVELGGKYSLNVIQSCAFGMEGESFKESPSEMYYLLKNIFNFGFTGIVKMAGVVLFPKVFNFLGLSMTTQNDTKIHSFVRNMVSERNKSVSARRDFLYYMLESQKLAKQSEDGSYVVDDDAIVAQIVLFMFAGFEQVKSNLSFLIHNITKYPEEQVKLRDELRQVQTEEGIDFQKLQELQYLDAFICETMRIYPSAYMAERCCTKDYNIPDTDVTIPKGMVVNIPTYSLHHDPNYWDEPEEFRPSRFLKENKHQINNYAYLPFGIGPRNCLGNRFALMELKIALAKMLLSFDIKRKPGTSLKIARSFMSLKPDDDGVHIILNKLED